MELTPREKDKLLLFTAGLVAERRKDKGKECKKIGDPVTSRITSFTRFLVLSRILFTFAQSKTT